MKPFSLSILACVCMCYAHMCKHIHTHIIYILHITYCLCMSINTCSSACECIQKLEVEGGSLSHKHSLPYSLRNGLIIEPRVHQPTRWLWESPCLSISHIDGLSPCPFSIYVGSGDSNSGPHFLLSVFNYCEH